MPYYMLHSIYYDYWQYQLAQEKKSDEQKASEAMDEVLRDSM